MSKRTLPKEEEENKTMTAQQKNKSHEASMNKQLGRGRTSQTQ